MARLPTHPLLHELNAACAQLQELPNPAGKGATLTAMRYGDSWADELTALLTGTALCDWSGRSLLQVQGKDSAKWLHGLCTQDIKGIASGAGAYACHIDIKGRIVTDFRVTKTSDSFLLDLEPGEAKRIRRAFKRFIVMEDVKVINLSTTHGTLGLVGPGVTPILGDAFETLPTHSVIEESIAGISCRVIASDLYGQRGARIIAPREQLPVLWMHFEGQEGVTFAGEDALEALRIRSGRPRFGSDLSDSVLFNEALLDDAVSFTKGCYLGQEIVERVDARGRVGRKLVALKLDCTAQTLPTSGSKVFNAKRALGTLTSSAWQPDLGFGLGLGLVHRSDNDLGAALKVGDIEGASMDAKVITRGQPS